MSMKKYLSTVVLTLLLLHIWQPVQAQDDISVELGGTEAKSVAKARSIGYTNTVSPIALGVGTVAITDNNTFETVGAGLAVYGLIIGPSTANFHVEDYKRGALGAVVRGVGAFLMADATREIFGDDFADALTIDDRKVSLTDTKILIGEVLILGSMVYNIVSAKASVREYNRRSRFSLKIDSEQINFKNKTAPMLTAQIRL
ncbi:hypothetical protein [Fodinibius halophilus]|uniref:DUF5683 domain-containing protein n=1 Tax=Fodinibius halophilus TaxID=1736908 RepID=A0A6M1T6P7_9BACT|nr:hypothetical protein [Fodinibius halophilus]NGP89827.1 hypothetical protein [Fodinibius halophilus]